MIIKQEISQYVDIHESQNVQTQQIAECSECRTNTAQIDSLKSRNEKFMCDLNQAINERDRLMEKVKEQHNQHKSDQDENQKLMDRNQALKARVDELELELRQNGLFEVENIIDHKRVRSCLLFKVRWKGFDSAQDTWEKRKNLTCHEILSEYLERNNLS